MIYEGINIRSCLCAFFSVREKLLPLNPASSPGSDNLPPSFLNSTPLLVYAAGSPAAKGIPTY